jgi:hypothetical protein
MAKNKFKKITGLQLGQLILEIKQLSYLAKNLRRLLRQLVEFRQRPQAGLYIQILNSLVICLLS